VWPSGHGAVLGQVQLPTAALSTAKQVLYTQTVPLSPTSIEDQDQNTKKPYSQDYNNNNNNRIYIAPYSRNFRGAGRSLEDTVEL